MVKIMRFGLDQDYSDEINNKNIFKDKYININIYIDCKYLKILN